MNHIKYFLTGHSLLDKSSLVAGMGNFGRNFFGVIQSLRKNLFSFAISGYLFFLPVFSTSQVFAADHESELKPLVDCYVKINNELVAYFAYKNGQDRELEIEIGENNYFYPDPIHRGQPTKFLMGHQHYVFAVSFNEGDLPVWNLNGRSATITDKTPQCPQPTSSVTLEPSKTSEPTSSVTPDPSKTPEPTSSVTPEPSKTSEPTSSVTPDPSKTPEPTSSVIPDPSKTPEPTSSVTPEPSKTPEPTSSVTPEPSKTPEPTSSVTLEPSKTPEPTSSVTPEPSKTPEPTSSVTPGPSKTPEPTSSVTPEPSKTPEPNISPASPVFTGIPSPPHTGLTEEVLNEIPIPPDATQSHTEVPCPLDSTLTCSIPNVTTVPDDSKNSSKILKWRILVAVLLMAFSIVMVILLEINLRKHVIRKRK